MHVIMKGRMMIPNVTMNYAYANVLWKWAWECMLCFMQDDIWMHVMYLKLYVEPWMKTKC